MSHLKREFGLTLLDQTPPGTCTMRAVAHDPEQPHNQQSLAYKYKFYDQYGRWPTWADAMEHCSADVKARWKAELTKHGIDVDRKGN